MTLLPALVKRELLVSQHSDREGNYYLGIDLGTTKSIATVVDEGALIRGDLGNAVRMIRIRQETDQGVIDSPVLPLLSQGYMPRRQVFYSSKSEMGIGRDPYYPYAADPALNCPYKIAGKILKTLCEASESEFGTGALER
ncbi:MAG: hypothetical protein GX620_16915 [Chloroflexi bacterium]|nr:hypothetical protein [Chloroflexota bacterium]